MENTSTMYNQLMIVLVSSIIVIALYSWIFVQSSHKSDEMHRARQIYFTRLTGFVLFGIVPVLILSIQFNEPLNLYGTLLIKPLDTFYWIIGLSILVILLSLRQAVKPQNLKQYPQIRSQNWSITTLLFSAITWIIYLLAYEFFFRGFLFFSCINVLGLWWAIGINTILYAAAHIPKGKFETIGAIPLGIVLCLITYQTQSIWVAFVVHTVMALSNEWISLYYHKEMNVQFTLKSNP